jgi:hypothetical protein
VAADVASAEQVFAHDDGTLRECLKSIWPELYAALAPRPGDARGIGCVLGSCCDLDADTRPRAAGRVTLNGTPACVEHLAASSRPGGYPLPLTDPRKWKS